MYTFVCTHTYIFFFSELFGNKLHALYHWMLHCLIPKNRNILLCNHSTVINSVNRKFNTFIDTEYFWSTVNISLWSIDPLIYFITVFPFSIGSNLGSGKRFSCHGSLFFNLGHFSNLCLKMIFPPPTLFYRKTQNEKCSISSWLVSGYAFLTVIL